jgi:hypothetical protein
MRKLLIAVASIGAAAALSASASGGVVTPHRITEMFRGSTIDFTNVWWYWGSNQPSYASFGQADGALTVNVSGDAQPDFGVGGATRCVAHGDFDARVAFDLRSWPAENGTWVNLAITGTPFNVYRVSWQFPEHEAYGAYFPPSNGNASATGTTGQLRLTREGSTITAYYLGDGGIWVPVLSSGGPTDDASFTLGVFNISNAATFAGLPVSVSFDNLHVSADAIVCP